jgi:diphosphomevalonate decarboxylase
VYAFICSEQVETTTDGGASHNGGNGGRTGRQTTEIQVQATECRTALLYSLKPPLQLGKTPSRIALMTTQCASARASSNIAFIKYWGLADIATHEPANDSVSMTLDAAHTVTRVVFDAAMPGDEFVLDGILQSGNALARVSQHLDRLRTLAGTASRARVDSHNSFPANAGIASSASGFAALTGAAAAALALPWDSAAFSRLARLASGSAARSIYGGFVQWLAGRHEQESAVQQIARPEHWQLNDVVCIVSNDAKPASSEEGHKVAPTSPFHLARIAGIPPMQARAVQAIQERDLAALGEVSEADALAMHGVMMTSRPSLLYWHATTVALMHAVRRWRSEGLPVYFTIDAGPNVHVLVEPTHLPELLLRLSEVGGVQRTLVCGPGEGLTLIA